MKGEPFWAWLVKSNPCPCGGGCISDDVSIFISDSSDFAGVPSADTLWSDFATALSAALASPLSGSRQFSSDNSTVTAAVIFSLSCAAEDVRVLVLGEVVLDAAGDFAFLCCVF